MKIVQFKAENIKRLKAIEITPDGNVVVLGGRNGQGKSSVLDAIMMALGGKDFICSQPIRKGTGRGEVELDLGDILVRRTFTPGGGTLSVSNRDGMKYGTPQAVLDRLIGTLTFDPLAFSRMKPREQLDTLRRMVGLDFTELDAKRAAAFAERTSVNRRVSELTAQVKATPDNPNAPDAEVSSSDILAKIEEATSTNNANAAIRRDAASRGEMLATAEANTKRLRRELEQAEKHEAACRAAHEKARAKSAAAIDIDITPFREELRSVEATNAAVHAKKARAALVAELKRRTKESDALTEQIAACDAAKRNALEEAKFPLPGLSLDDQGVVLNGLPFDQASAAEQLKASVAIGMAMNPNLRVMQVRDGSLLDDESMRTLAEMAQAADFQVWIERVGAGDEVHVVIEDGEVAHAESSK